MQYQLRLICTAIRKCFNWKGSWGRNIWEEGCVSTGRKQLEMKQLIVRNCMCCICCPECEKWRQHLTTTLSGYTATMSCSHCFSQDCNTRQCTSINYSVQEVILLHTTVHSSVYVSVCVCVCVCVYIGECLYMCIQLATDSCRYVVQWLVSVAVSGTI